MKLYSEKNFYFTAVYASGVPMYLRDLTETEAAGLFDVHATGAVNGFPITYAQYGESGQPPTNQYCKGAEFGTCTPSWG